MEDREGSPPVGGEDLAASGGRHFFGTLGMVDGEDPFDGEVTREIQEGVGWEDEADDVDEEGAEEEEGEGPDAGNSAEKGESEEEHGGLSDAGSNIAPEEDQRFDSALELSEGWLACSTLPLPTAWCNRRCLVSGRAAWRGSPAWPLLRVCGCLCLCACEGESGSEREHFSDSLVCSSPLTAAGWSEEAASPTAGAHAHASFAALPAARPSGDSQRAPDDIEREHSTQCERAQGWVSRLSKGYSLRIPRDASGSLGCLTCRRSEGHL